MRTMSAVVVLLCGLAVSIVAIAGSKSESVSTAKTAEKSAVSRDGWPDTRPGAVGRHWVKAFRLGETAMREFYLVELSAESLAKRSADARLETYRTFRERFGTLMFASIVKSAPTELTVKLMDADAKPHTFVFKVEAAAPHKLESISMTEMRPGGHFHH